MRIVFLSNAVISPSRTGKLVEKLATECCNNGGGIKVGGNALWETAALSVARQQQLYGERKLEPFEHRLKAYINDCADLVAKALPFGSAAMRQKFCLKLKKQALSDSCFEIKDEVKELLAALKLGGVRVGAIANFPMDYKQFLLRQNVVLEGPIVQAWNGMFKPQSRIFAHALAKTPAAFKYNAAFVGSLNDPCDVMSRAPGMKRVLVKNADLSVLGKLGIAAGPHTDLAFLKAKKIPKELPLLHPVEKFVIGTEKHPSEPSLFSLRSR